MQWPEFIVPDNEQQAREVQNVLRSQIRLSDEVENPRIIAGVDVGYDNERELARASVVTMTLDSLEPIEQIQVMVPVHFPYIPGLLSFREIPAILEALSQLNTMPDILMVDGQGIAHPRRMGIAAHLGVICNLPSIGVAKSRLTGRFEMPGEHKGDTSPLMLGKERIGTVLRSRNRVNPLFISPGHRISQKTAVAITKRCLTRYRLPEPTRLADKYSKHRHPNLVQ